ncbi:MAG: DUF1624 domain-containing protein [Rubrivivax sp.]|nr:DUF1624 domain-containing protein [Rubrivivax sp.]
MTDAGRVSPVERFDRLDALRGVAILWMALYHLGFDLNHFRLLTPVQDVYRDPFWTWQRTAILSLFLLCAGAGQAVALASGQDWPRFWRRWRWVAGCALLVSLGSWFVFPRSWISFGVLHGMALMLIVVRLTAGWRRWLWPLGLAAVLLPRFVAHPFFDLGMTNWIGLVTHKPITEDWVPVLPWLGVMWWGCAGGQWLLARRRGWLAEPLAKPLRPLAALGRWSLSFYMAHQPVFFGALLAWQALRAQA